MNPRHLNAVTRDDQRLQDDSDHAERLHQIFDGNPPPAVAGPGGGGGIDTTTRTSTDGVRPGDTAAERDHYADALADTTDLIDVAIECARHLNDACKRAAASCPASTLPVLIVTVADLCTLAAFARDLEGRLARVKEHLP